MPLLYKSPFRRNEEPEDLGDDEEVFYCELTNEIFRDYEEYCERIILCNSLVWACSLSGRANLTYQEALDSERNAKAMLNDFPMELRIPVLYLTTLTQRKSLNELAEDVYCFAKDRYFVGENVEVEIPGGSLTSCYIIKVIEPTPEELNSIGKQTPKNGERLYWPPSTSYKYYVQPVSKEKAKVITVAPGVIHRKKGVYSRAKNRLYIKQFTEQVDGLWKLKDAIADKYNISKVEFSAIFAGEAPELTPTKKTSPTNQSKAGGSGKKEKRQESIEKYFTKKSPSKQNGSQSSDQQQKTLLQKLKEKYKQNSKTSLNNKVSGKHDAFKQKRKYNKKKLLQSADKNSVLSEPDLKQRKTEEKLKLKELKRKKKEQLALLMKEYNRKKDDLELEDLQDLPEPLPIDLRFPNELFGDFVMILEFLNNFKDTVNVKDYFPNGVTFELLERALVEKEVAGPLSDILQMLLAAIFELQEGEDDEIREDSDLKSSDWQDMDVAGDEQTKEAVKQATIAARWAQAYHRTPLGKLTLDSSTLTEVLRLHLLASGGRCGENSAKWRYQQRGGYSSLDDPGLALRLSQPHILDQLAQDVFCDLPIPDKLAILSCLVSQILTFASVRDKIDESMDKIRQGRVELRNLSGNDRRREQEAVQKFKDGEWTAEQLEHERELLHKRKVEQNRRVRELTEENSANQVLPLGADRAYRRYWLFPALPGLFVEDDERQAGVCLPKGTPALDLGLIQGEDPEIYVKRLFEEGSNKENLLKTPTKTQLTPTKTPSKSSLKSPGKGATTPSKKVVVERRPLTCWGDPQICPVHGKNSSRVCWAYIKDESDFNMLVNNLNKRGLRENSLQAALEEDREKILQSISRCPTSKLNPTLCPDQQQDNRKSTRNNPRYENANLNYPPGTPPDEILESVLRELILETEEKLNNGHLGSLKVVDREAWREAITNNSYDQQCDKLTFGGNGKNTVEMTNGHAMEEDETSRPSTPSSEASFRDLQLDTNVEQSTRVKELACAILQLEQSVDPKYLKRPLGVDRKENNEKGSKAAQLARERWETSLMASTSISQLFLHISTLDSSVTWGRSILKAYCRLCRRKGDAEKMLLCDECNKGHHMYCLKPKLTSVPKGNWYCAKCKPREKATPVKKNRRVFMEESDDEEKENEEQELPQGMCKVCRSRGPVIVCETCSKGYHFDCINPPLRKIPSGNWYCHSCRKGQPPPKQTSTSKKDETSPSSDVERSSRRRSSKAATAKISQFAKQLRTNSWEVEREKEVEGRRRSRRSLEAELLQQNSNTSASKDLPLDNATLQEILEQLMHHEDAWPFLKPVTKADVEDYHKIIKHPMDFGTIKHKLNMLEYRTNSEVLADALLVFENCYSYNKDDTEIYQCGVRLHQLLEKLCEERGLDLCEEDRPPVAKKPRTTL